jgi:hypothetical protein
MMVHLLGFGCKCLADHSTLRYSVNDVIAIWHLLCLPSILNCLEEKKTSRIFTLISGNGFCYFLLRCGLWSPKIFMNKMLHC